MATDWRTSSAWWPTTDEDALRRRECERGIDHVLQQRLSAGACSTLAWRLFMRVPSPAARITMVTGFCIYYYYAFLRRRAFLRQLHHNGGGGVGIVADLLGMAGQIARPRP